jgi:Bacterial SH3 domain
VRGRLRAPVRALLPAALVVALAAGGAYGEDLYVVEQVVVNVNSAPDASGERIATVKSGERVEVLERVRDQVHVRLADGKDGWIRASYLSADEPLRVRLAQRDQQLTQLQQDVSRLQAQLATAHAPAAPASSAAVSDASAPAATVAPPTVAPTAAEDPGGTAPMFAAGGEQNAYHLWPWTLAAALLGLGVGFALGVLVLDRHIRRKYGGLRIY